MPTVHRQPILVRGWSTVPVHAMLRWLSGAFPFTNLLLWVFSFAGCVSLAAKQRASGSQHLLHVPDLLRRNRIGRVRPGQLRAVHRLDLLSRKHHQRLPDVSVKRSLWSEVLSKIVGEQVRGQQPRRVLSRLSIATLDVLQHCLLCGVLPAHVLEC